MRYAIDTGVKMLYLCNVRNEELKALTPQPPGLTSGQS